MDAKDYFPYGKPQIIPPVEFFKAYERLREADYRDFWLRDIALEKLEEYAARQKPHAAESAKDEIYYLWGLCLQAEIHDYYENYGKAREVLKDEGKRLKRSLAKNRLGSGDEADKPLLRQQLWVLILCAHCEYRSQNWDLARSLLLDIQDRVDGDFPLDPDQNPDEPSYGLRARIAYSLGQVARRLADLSARDQFVKAIGFTRKRLLRKMEKNVDKYPGQLDREMKYANYIIAKAFSFGLAWASYHSGELQRALGAASAGSAMLETTSDPVHKAYAHVMYAQILSATVSPVRNGGEPPEPLKEAIALLISITTDNRQPLAAAPKLLARAHYVLAYAHFLAGHFQKAEQLADSIYKRNVPGRWQLECAALLTRIFLAQKLTDKARAMSDELTELAKPKTPKKTAPSAELAKPEAATQPDAVTNSQRAEAFLCRAEVLMQAARHRTQEIDKALTKEIHKALAHAEELSKGNPLLLTACGLQWGRYHVLIGNREKAHEYLQEWELVKDKIEQGYIRQLADDLREEIFQIDPRLIIVPQELLEAGTTKDLDKKLKLWIVRMMYAKYGADYRAKGSRFLRISEDTIDNWEDLADSDPLRTTHSEPSLIISPRELEEGTLKELNRKVKLWILRVMRTTYGADYRSKTSEILGVPGDEIANWESLMDFDPERK